MRHQCSHRAFSAIWKSVETHTHTNLILRKLKTTLIPRVRWVLNYCLSHQLCKHWKDYQNQMGAALCLCISAKQHLTLDSLRLHV